MDDTDDLRRAFLGVEKDRRARAPSGPSAPSETRRRRIERAQRRLRRAYSPLRILMLVVMSPVVAMGMATSIYISTSPFAPPDALGHVVAMGGCEAAAVVGLVPARPGQPGYHAALDPDGDGRTCLAADAEVAQAEAAMPGDAAGTRQSGGAKFLRVGQ